MNMQLLQLHSTVGVPLTSRTNLASFFLTLISCIAGATLFLGESLSAVQ